MLVAIGTAVALVVAIACGLVIGPTSIGTWRIVGDMLAHIGIGHNTLTPLQTTIVWQYRAPRMVIGLLAGSMLAVAGGTYQGVFRNPLADPYLLGVASGAGLGATYAIIDISHGTGTPSWTPLLAFVGALGAVIVTWLIGGRTRSSTVTLILAGVAVASLLGTSDVLANNSRVLARSRGSTSGSWVRSRVPAGARCGLDRPTSLFASSSASAPDGRST